MSQNREREDGCEAAAVFFNQRPARRTVQPEYIPTANQGFGNGLVDGVAALRIKSMGLAQMSGGVGERSVPEGIVKLPVGDSRTPALGVLN
jgi:hypothetical protein